METTEERPESKNASPENVEEVEFFKTKLIRFGPIDYTIITQNKNGPCPVIALINVLVLKGKIQLPNNPIISNDRLINILTELLLKPPSDEESLKVYESNLQDVIPMMSTLNKGLDVNVKFSNITDFEFTPALSLFDLLHVDLYHIWLPDPQLSVLYDLVKNLSYNELVVKMCTESDEASILAEFHEDSKNQITFYGLSKLVQHMKDGDLAVLFRNNHFNTILKRRDEIFTLVTDEGFAEEPNIVWESLSSVDGDSFFVNCDFQTYRSDMSKPKTLETRPNISRSTSPSIISNSPSTSHRQTPLTPQSPSTPRTPKKEKTCVII